MAAQRVFDIAELFEAILLQLEITELFVNHRVSKAWRDWIQSSRPLTRKMFVTSGPPAINLETIQGNPLISRAIGEADTPTKGWAYPTATWRKTLLFRPALKNVTLRAFVESQSDKHLVDSVAGSGLWRSLSLDSFMREVERKIVAKRLMATNLKALTVEVEAWSADYSSKRDIAIVTQRLSGA
ncbi:hypothetical protein LTR85_001518 [Meristemomyces frigidus]|nr:hypothetical protein LTR85_001518 [Meristemomyces frigidus]